MTWPRKSVKHGFTLIELLVVIAIIALLIGIMLPALGTARQTAWSLVDQTQLRSIGSAQYGYASESDDYFAAINTSGSGGQREFERTGNAYTGNTSATTPIQIMDFISPTIGEDLGFSANRARRAGDIFNDFADPAARVLTDTIWSGSDAADEDDFREYLGENRGYRQTSYLMPGAFAYWGSFNPGGTFVPGQPPTPDQSDSIRARLGFLPQYWTGAKATQVNTPRRFQGRIEQVGISPSSKIMVADGTRFFSESEGLDIDITPVEDNGPTFGMFTSGTPQFTGNTAYGRNPLMGGDSGTNQRLSFRHKNNSINAVFFDGHTENLTEAEVMSDMGPWAPSGSVVVGSELGRLTEEAQDYARELPDATSDLGRTGFRLP